MVTGNEESGAGANRQGRSGLPRRIGESGEAPEYQISAELQATLLNNIEFILAFIRLRVSTMR